MTDEERYINHPEPTGLPGMQPGPAETPSVSTGFSGPADGAPQVSGSAQEPLPPASGPAPTNSGTSASSTGATSGRNLPVHSSGVAEDDRLMAGLTWLSALILQIPLVSLVLLLAEPNRSRPFQRYHAIASIAFWVVAVAYEVVAAIVYLVLSVITLGVGFVCLWPIFFVPHILALYYTYTAFVGREPQIPVITDLMRRQGWA